LDALKRELLEEIGTEKFDNIQELPFGFYFDFPKDVQEKSGFIGQEVKLFLADFYGTEEDINIDMDEISNFLFLDKEEFLKKLSFENTRNSFLKLIKNHKIH